MAQFIGGLIGTVIGGAIGALLSACLVQFAAKGGTDGGRRIISVARHYSVVAMYVDTLRGPRHTVLASNVSPGLATSDQTNSLEGR